MKLLISYATHGLQPYLFSKSYLPNTLLHITHHRQKQKIAMKHPIPIQVSNKINKSVYI